MVRQAAASAFGTALLLTAIAEPSTGQTVPEPRSVLGAEVGADFFLATYEQSMAYFERLDAASDRLQLMDVGTSSFGRTMRIAVISSAENLQNLDRYRDIAQQLAHPEGMTDEQARALAREGRAIVWIDGGLHASEVAHAQHTIQLAYDLITGDADPEIAAILENVIFLLWPSINPDGQTMVADWYMGNVGTRYEASGMPALYQKYIGHDNNRDGYMISVPESRVGTRVAREWEPQILYNHHQSSPFPTRIWIPPFAEPISPHVHPLMWRTVNLIGMSMSQALEERGQRGATHMGTGFDNWYPGFMDHAHNFHNVASLLTETAGAGGATPRFYTLGDFPADERELRPRSMYSSPWQGGWWRLRDAVDYMLTASTSVLDFAAKYKEDLLYNRYQAGRDIIAQYRTEPPYAYIIPKDQRDPVAAVEMLRRLAFNGIRIHELNADLMHDGIEHPAGTWVIPMDQEFAHFARQLFDVQSYPDLVQYPGGPPDAPYDISGWTLPYQMDVQTIEARSPIENLRSLITPLEAEPVPWDTEGDASVFDSPIDVGFDTSPLAAAIVPPAGSVEGGGAALHLDPAQNNTFRAMNRAWAQGGTVRFVAGESPDELRGAGTSGHYVITGLSGAVRDQLVQDLHLQATGGSADGIVIDQPRIAVYRPWSASIDEGWTRWLLDSFDFEYTSLRNPEVIAGRLGERYDVIVFASMGSGTILNGSSEGSMPGRYAGGIGEIGMRNLDDFVRQGGTMVTWNGSSNFAIDQLHLPVRNVTRGLGNTEFGVGGSVLESLVDPGHPVMSGMPERAKVMVSGDAAFTTEEGFEGKILGKFQEEGSPLLSGFLLGEEHIQGYATAVEAEHGDGRVILMGLHPHWRGQPFGTFKILFNSLMYTDAVAAEAPGNPGFWTAPEEDESGDEAEAAGGGRGGRGGGGGQR